MLLPRSSTSPDMNRLSERILTTPRLRSWEWRVHARFQPAAGGKPLIAATMFGVTTPCVTARAQWLEERGYEVLVFHATGDRWALDGGTR